MHSGEICDQFLSQPRQQILTNWRDFQKQKRCSIVSDICDILTSVSGMT